MHVRTHNNLSMHVSIHFLWRGRGATMVLIPPYLLSILVLVSCACIAFTLPMTESTKREENVLLSDPSTGTIARASSILQKNNKLYGPMNALDTENGSTCWNSDASNNASQFLLIDFQRHVQPSCLKIEFQAGFIAETCTIQLKVSDCNEWVDLDEIEPDDNHDVQEFILDSSDKTGTALKLVFDDFTDFYGRVTIYRIQVWGKEVS